MTEAPAPRWWPAVQAMLWLAALFFAWHGLHPLLHSVAVIRDFPWSIDREEGFLLDQALRLRAGRTIYPALADYPFTVGNYPPVYPALMALVSILVPGLAAGRILVLAAAGGLAITAGLYVWRNSRSAPLALLAPGLFLCSWNVNEWIPYARVDFPALLFGFTGFVVAGLGAGRRQVAAAGVLFLLAAYTRQTQLLAPVAVAVGLMLQGRRREAVWLVGGLAAAGLAVLAILLLLTRGQFWLHTVTYNRNPMEWWQFTVWMKNVVWFFGRWQLLALAVALAGSVCLRREEVAARPPAPDLLVYLGLAAVSLLTIAKKGSAANYQLEFDLLVAVTLAAAAGRLLAVARSGNRRRQAGGWLAATLVLLSLHAGRTWMLRPILFPPPPGAAERQPSDALALTVAEESGEVLTELPLYVIRAGRPVLYQPFIMASLAEEGKWDPAPFLADLERGRFALLLATQDFATDKTVTGFTPAMMDAILRRYELTERVHTWRQPVYLYRPKKPQPPESATR